MHRWTRKLWFRGNLAALSRLAVISLCIVVAAVLGWYLKASASVIVGSFIGAALSLAVNWLALTLENPDVEMVPAGFLAAAKNDVLLAGYYRQGQYIHFSVAHDETLDSEIIEIRFGAKLVPVTPSARIYHPKSILRSERRSFRRLIMWEASNYRRERFTKSKIRHLMSLS